MNLSNILNFFVRKVRIFNKSRYSRNRQNVKITFYFALYINIIVIYAVFSVFYNFVFLLSYNYVFFYLFLASFFLPNFIRVFKKTNY